MNSQIRGYYRYPTLHGDVVAFVVEDDLWRVRSTGGTAHRLTANLGQVTHPFFSPDGEWLAFIGREEGPAEVYIMPAAGGPARRLTHLGSNSMVVSWHEEKIVFASDFAQPFRNEFWLYTVDMTGNEPQRLPFGPARNIGFGRQGVIIGRNTGDPARWKRYRGGTAGELWIDEGGTGEFHKLIELEGNLANPMWIGDRIFFISDHKGIGNIHSCLPSGKDLTQHTYHKEFYARNATSDGHRIVYHSGADVYTFDPGTGETVQVAIEYYSPRIQRNRKFVRAQEYLEDYTLDPDGSSLALISRGKSFTVDNWEGPVIQQGVRNGVRYRLTRWLSDGKNVVLVSDEGGEDHLELHSAGGLTEPQRLTKPEIGRPDEIQVNPKRNEIVVSNHRHELIWIDLGTGESKKIEQSKHGPVAGFGWSPDGRWVVYSFPTNHHIRIIKVYDVETNAINQVTEPLLQDVAPVFDPTGKYLYFLSNRVFNPVYDKVQFDLNFPKSMRPYAITLQKDLPSPFVPRPRGFKEKKEDQEQPEAETAHIDFDGIAERIVPFPVEEAIYGEIAAARDKVFYTTYPVEGARGAKWFAKEPAAKASVKVFDMDELEEVTFVDKVTSFKLSADGSAMACRIGNRLRVIRTKRSLKEELPKEEKPSRKTGWIDLSRLKVSIEPTSEWQQMLAEAWRLQRDYFWVEDMSGVDWKRVLERYHPLVERAASRSEFSDLLWEMQGELGTSHAYELGGDYRPKPEYKLGFLGADLTYEPEHDAYRFSRILTGDVWDDENPPPLKRPGVNVEEGMLLLAVGGERVSRDSPPAKLLVNQAGQEVQLTVAESDTSSPRTVCVKASGDETPLRYREWVEGNRRHVHEATNGRVGYIHIPDMGADGYAEFHRYFLTEFDHEGLIVDVRFNGGGHVSALLLQKLARQRLGYNLSRWMGHEPYPAESVRGPIVALTNEQAGSDGDLFCHAFKLMKLGKLIGRRTWGGVIGIWPRNWLVDGSLTTQPEFSFWFKDVGWGVENYGTDPDIEVDITPQEYAVVQDTQLERALVETLKDIEAEPPLEPDFSKRPKRTLPG